MKSFFQELFEYNFNFNQEIFSKMTENHGLVSAHLIKLSSHLINVHQIWNNRIIAAQQPYKPWDTHAVSILKEIDKANFHTSLAILDQFEMDFPIQYSLMNGKTFRNNVRDLLFQIINHSTYHRGQIATEFRRCNIEPLLTDWIAYKWRETI